MTERLIITADDLTPDLTKPGTYTPEQVAEYLGSTEQALAQVASKEADELKTEDVYLVDSLVYHGAMILNHLYEEARFPLDSTDNTSDYSLAAGALAAAGKIEGSEVLPGLDRFGVDKADTSGVLVNIIMDSPKLESISPAHRDDIFTLAKCSIGLIKEMAAHQGGLTADGYVTEKLTPIKNGTNLVLAQQGQI